MQHVSFIFLASIVSILLVSSAPSRGKVELETPLLERESSFDHYEAGVADQIKDAELKQADVEPPARSRRQRLVNGSRCES